MKFDLPEDVLYIINTLQDAGFDAYIVGGCVRDLCLGILPKDYDFTTSATPQEVRDVFDSRNVKIIPTGEKFGTLTIRLNNNSYEVTTFRADGRYENHRHPKSVGFSRNLADDLARRDFTINAMAYNSGGFTDLHGGLADLQNKVIRAVGNPAERFKEDVLRILRALRFSGRLNFSIERGTYKAMLDNKHLLKFIAYERITAELSEILPNLTIQNIDEASPFLQIIFPILQKLDFDQNNPYHIYTVLRHTLVAAACASKNIYVRLALLLHDIGKMQTQVVNSVDGRHQFIGHEAVSSTLAREILKNLRYDNQTISTVCTLIYYHGRMFSSSKKGIKKLLNKIGEDTFLLLVEVYRADNLSKNLELSKKKLEKIDKVLETFNQIKADEECFSIKQLAINGNDLLENNLAKGKEIGAALNKCLDYVIQNPHENNKETLLSYIKSLKK